MGKIARANKTEIKQRIESLEHQSQVVLGEMKDEMELSKEKIADMGKIALGIGGGLILSAIVLRGLLGRNKKSGQAYATHGSKRIYQRFIDQLMRELSGQATRFLLGIAKDKLTTTIEKKENAEVDDSEVAG